MEPLLQKGDSYIYLGQLLDFMKLTRDAIDPESHKIHIVIDIAIKVSSIETV